MATISGNAPRSLGRCARRTRRSRLCSTSTANGWTTFTARSSAWPATGRTNPKTCPDGAAAGVERDAATGMRPNWEGDRDAEERDRARSSRRVVSSPSSSREMGARRAAACHSPKGGPHRSLGHRGRQRLASVGRPGRFSGRPRLGSGRRFGSESFAGPAGAMKGPRRR